MAVLPHVLKRIRLVLARSRAFPVGSSEHGYEFVAPLDQDGHLDPEVWRDYRDNCRVKRFWDGEDDELGWLVYRSVGEAGHWRFYYEKPFPDDEIGYRLEAHTFRNGEYVSIRDEDGETHTFQVASVEPAT